MGLSRSLISIVSSFIMNSEDACAPSKCYLTALLRCTHNETAKNETFVQRYWTAEQPTRILTTISSGTKERYDVLALGFAVVHNGFVSSTVAFRDFNISHVLPCHGDIF